MWRYFESEVGLRMTEYRHYVPTITSCGPSSSRRRVNGRTPERPKAMHTYFTLNLAAALSLSHTVSSRGLNGQIEVGRAPCASVRYLPRAAVTPS